jgi:predicted permease
LLFALLPALSATRVDLRSALQTGDVRSGRSAGRARAVLTVLQLAFSVTLLTGAGVAVRTAINLTTMDPGLRTARVLTLGMEFPDRDYPTASSLSAVLDEARRALSSLPGVESAHVLSSLPMLADGPITSLRVENQPEIGQPDAPWALVSGIDAGGLASLQVPLLAGRWFSSAEADRNAPLAIVGRATADRYFGSVEGAVGRRLTVTASNGERMLEIVGVCGDVLTGDLERGPLPRVWTPLGTARRVKIVVLTAGPPADLAGSARRALASVAPLVPAEDLEPYDTALARQNASDYVIIGVFALFSLLSLGLATMGLYGVVSYSVSQRASEFGTRYALGAQVRDVLGLVLRQSFGWLAAGLALGLTGGLLLTWGMRTALFGVSPSDPLNLASVTALLALVTLAASIVPALRAARVDLVKALRTE